MLEVQKFLKNGGTFELLSETYGIKVREYPEDRVVMLNYDQIESPKSHPIVIECRSLVIHIDTLDVVSMKFPRFFNMGECPHLYEGFDISKCRIMEKADGSIIGFHHIPFTDRWEISTRSMLKAEGVNAMGQRFRDLILETSGFKTEDDFQNWCVENLSNSETYIFEWISPLNRIVTPYKTDCLVLLGVSNRKECAFYNWDTMTHIAEKLSNSGLNVRLPKTWDGIKDSDQLVKTLQQLDPLEEGFVAWCEETNRRLKLKNSTYLIAHKMRGETGIPSKRNILSLVLDGEVDEFLCYFPEMEVYVSPIRQIVSEIEQNLIKAWEETKHIESQKDFAIAIKKIPLNGVLFTARKNGVDDPVHVFHGIELSKKIKMLEVIVDGLSEDRGETIPN